MKDRLLKIADYYCRTGRAIPLDLLTVMVAEGINVSAFT